MHCNTHCRPGVLANLPLTFDSAARYVVDGRLSVPAPGAGDTPVTSTNAAVARQAGARNDRGAWSRPPVGVDELIDEDRRFSPEARRNVLGSEVLQPAWSISRGRAEVSLHAVRVLDLPSGLRADVAPNVLDGPPDRACVLTMQSTILTAWSIK